MSSHRALASTSVPDSSRPNAACTYSSRGGRIAPDGTILNADGELVTDEHGNAARPMFANPNIPPGGSIGPGGIEPGGIAPDEMYI